MIANIDAEVLRRVLLIPREKRADYIRTLMLTPDQRRQLCDLLNEIKRRESLLLKHSPWGRMQ